jgi:hypothetical protein
MAKRNYSGKNFNYFLIVVIVILILVIILALITKTRCGSKNTENFKGFKFFSPRADYLNYFYNPYYTGYGNGTRFYS